MSDRPTVALIGECMIELSELHRGGLSRGYGGDVLNTSVYLSRLMGARSAAEARGFVMQQLRRRLGVVVAREMARHRLHRLPYVNTPRAVDRRRPRGRLIHGA